jgi:Ca-activated chloride channel family protein
MQVAVEVVGPIARTRIEQSFENPGDGWIEGLYVFPLPDNSAVDRLTLRIGERWIEGEIREREQARQEYEAARAEGRRASLLEQQRPNLFATAVANIGPHETVDVIIEYQHTLRWDAGRFELRLPLVVAPRYLPGGLVDEDEAAILAEPARPDPSASAAPAAADPAPAPRLAPGSLAPLALLRVELDGGLPVRAIESPTHRIAPSSSSQGPAIEQWVAADRDFVLTWQPEASSEPRVAIFREAGAVDEALLVMLIPPTLAAKGGRGSGERLDREVIFVIDTSGSMGGSSIREARRALELALDRLEERDHFNVIAFSSTFHTLFSHSERADPHSLDRARRFVRSLEAGGGTEMLPALKRALRDDGRDVGLRQVIFATDGAIGNEGELFEAIESGLGRSRLFTVGIGSAPNAYFLERAAKFGRGSFTYVATGADVAPRMEALFAKLERPLLSDLELDWGVPVDAWPRRIPDLYAGEPLIVAARAQHFGELLRVRGRRAGDVWRVEIPLAATPSPNPMDGAMDGAIDGAIDGAMGAAIDGAMGAATSERGIFKLWARRKIASLMESLSAGAPPDEVRDAVVSLALDHHLVSRYTSLVAVDRTPERPLGAGLARGAVPLAMPHGWHPSLSSSGVLPRTGTFAPLLFQIGVLAFAASLALAALARRASTP